MHIIIGYYLSPLKIVEAVCPAVLLAGPPFCSTMTTSGSGVLPSVLIPGAQKCGSTALAHYLAQHPGCTISKPKEPSFFSRLGNLDDMEAYSACFRDAQPGTVSFEASTGYLFEPYVPPRIARGLLPLQPNLKIVVVLRRPVDRAISAFLHLRKRMDDRRGMTEALGGFPSQPDDVFAEESRRLADALAVGLIDVERYRPRYDDYLWQFRYVGNSWYVEFLRRYIELFGRERLHVVFQEDLRADTTTAMQTVAAFLGLPPYEGGVLQAEQINPTLLLPGTNVFRRSPRGPVGAIVRRFPSHILPRFGRQDGGGLADNAAALRDIRSSLDAALSQQYEQLSGVIGRDVAEIWS